MGFEDLRGYYLGYGEDERFVKDRAHSIEFITSMHFLNKLLPKGSSVLDCCAGGGAYSFALAREGHCVTSGDLLKEHVDILKSKNSDGRLKEIYQGNVLDMSQFENEAFDVVLCMGALYHLVNRADREKCVSECLRVLKHGGIFAFAYVNRNAMFINKFIKNLLTIEGRAELLKTGVSDVFYSMNFGEVEQLTAKFPLDKITDIGVDGIIYPLYDRLNSCSKEEFNAFMDYHFLTCEEPSVIGHSIHGLWIGRKRDRDVL